MPVAAVKDLDQFERASRRSLWCALGIVLIVGAVALVLLAAPESQAALMATRLFMLLPLIVVFTGAWLRMSTKGISLDSSSAAMQAIQNDELRRASLHKAYRNGLCAVLLLQPLLALCLTSMNTPYPVAIMSAATALAGVASFLASLLYFDR